jgi:hypothetical protein
VTLELAERDDKLIDNDTKVLFVVAGAAILTGTEEVVFAYGATIELVTIEVKLVLSVTTGIDVFDGINKVMVESGTATEPLTKIELVGIELLFITVTDVLKSGNEVIVKIERVTELLVKTELVSMELLLIADIDVLKCVEKVAELLVIGVVVVEFKRGAAVITGVTVLLVTAGTVGIELSPGTMLLDRYKADDDEAMTRLDVVSGAIVGVQEVSEAVKVTVLSYTEATSRDAIWVAYCVSVVVTVATQGSVV